MNTNHKFLRILAAITLASTWLSAAATPSTSYYIYDESGHVIGEYDANGNPVQEHIYLGDKPVAVVQGGTVDNVTTDQLNTPRAITNSSQQVVWQWNSDPFGNGQPTGSLTYNLRFPGQYFDAETGHNYNYHRDYDPSTGRYIESDPTGLNGGIDTYAYASDNPSDVIDASGLLGWSVSQDETAGDFQTGGQYTAVPGYGSYTALPGDAAITTFSAIDVKSDCQCDGNGGAKFMGYNVTVRIQVHVRASYPQGADVAAWVRRAEGDHVNDFLNWANEEGRRAAQNEEDSLRGASFGSMDDCLIRTANALRGMLQAGANLARRQSSMAWDQSGLHNYANPGRRP